MSTTRDELAAIAGEKNAQKRSTLTGAFLADRMASIHTRVTMPLAKINGVADKPHCIDEISSIVMLTAVQIFKHLEEHPDQVDDYDMFERSLHLKARAPVRTYLSRCVDTATGTRLRRERSRRINNIYNALAQEQGRTPTRAEIRDAYNAQYPDHRRSRQADDYDTIGNMTARELTLDTTVDLIEQAAAETAAPLMPHETQDFLRQLIAEIDSIGDPKLIAVASLWADPATIENGEWSEPSIRTLAERLNIPKTTVGRYVAQVKDIARTILAKTYGVTSLTTPTSATPKDTSATP